MSLKRGSPASVMPRRPTSEMMNWHTSVRWMKRQSEHDQTSLPRLPTSISPRSVSWQG